jgi:lipoprotein-anchoring transpeptidase ErfK/SrfK
MILQNKIKYIGLLSMLILSIILVLANTHPVDCTMQDTLNKSPSDNSGYYLVIFKSLHTLILYNDSTLVKLYSCAVGKNRGDKQARFDYRTPEGRFYVTAVENSENWWHDFKNDKKGPVKDAYGPWFFRLYTGGDSTYCGKTWTGIGIHGTHDPSSIGKNVTEGCIRLNNNDLLELRPYVSIGLPVRIEE